LFSPHIYKTAIIGLGNIGFLFDLDSKRKDTWTHLTAYRKCSRTDIAGVVEVNPKNIEQFKSLYPDIPVYESVPALLNDQPVDLISICTPTATHFDIFQDIWNFPIKAVFCEKPISTDLNKARAILSESRARGIDLAVNYTRRWDPVYLRAAQMVASGEIGKIHAVNCFYTGQALNVGSHLFDLVRMLTKKDPISVSGISQNTAIPDPDISGWIELEDHIIATFNCSGNLRDLVFEIDVIGGQGRVRVIENGNKIDRFVFKGSERYSGYRELVPEPVGEINRTDRFVDAVNAIVDVLEGKKHEINCSGRDGFLALSICESLIRSANNSGKPFEVEHV